MNSPLRPRIEVPALGIQIAVESGAPSKTEQLVLQLRAAIEGGRLPAGGRLPSSRALARELGVSRTVATEGYAILEAEGYLVPRRGSGTYVAEPETAASSPPALRLPGRRPPRWLRDEIEPATTDPLQDPEGLRSFRICEPDPDSFPDRAWRTAARAAIGEPLPAGYGPPAGDPELRRLIASFLARERGLVCSARDVILLSGATQGLDLIARAVLRPGDPVAFEEPGYRLARQIFSDRGADVRPVPVDAKGLRVEELCCREPPLLVYTTPSHQFPVGSVLAYTRRARLLEWAAEHGILVIEDDYDSEFRFDGPALPALAAADRNGTVAYLGTFSKVLAPSLRLGYLIAPEPLRQAVCRLRARTDCHSDVLAQRTLARYIQSGGFGRHLRRMRRLYRERRDRLVAALEPLPEGACWIGLAAGLHATLRLPDRISARDVAARCRRRGVWVRTLDEYSASPDVQPDPEPNGLVLGYGASSAETLAAMAAVVRGEIDEV